MAELVELVVLIVLSAAIISKVILRPTGRTTRRIKRAEAIAPAP